ncbi:MAG: enoyl-ACP reductase FabI [Gammaproteobacteria bacterium]
MTPAEQYFDRLMKEPENPLKGKKALVLGIANNQSIAYGCAMGFRALGAELAVTYLNEKTKKHTEPLAKRLAAPLYLPCDVRESGQLEEVFATIAKTWGKLDIALHSIAFAPREDLHGRVTDCSREGFLMAMDVSCHSFIRMARLAEPLMKDGGTLFTMSYYGAEKVVERYNVMGPVKAALEASARYIAYELGSKGIRVHPSRQGPIQTRAATGIDRFDELMEMAAERTPAHAMETFEDVGMATAFLATGYARLITGDTLYIDGGYHILG